MDDESGESMEPMEEVPLIQLGEAELERLVPCAGAQALPLLGPRSRKPFPQIKIYHYTPGENGVFYLCYGWIIQVDSILVKYLLKNHHFP